MLIRPAQINTSGIKAVLRYAEDPNRLLLNSDPHSLDQPDSQTYIPGISVPDVALLSEPFNVPIIGDNESVSLSIDWPMRRAARYTKRVTFIGQLVAEKLTFGLINESAEEDNFTVSLDNNPFGYEEGSEEYDKDGAFEEYTGDYGGFLRAVVEASFNDDTKEVEKCGWAEFYCIEDEEEFYTLTRLMDSNHASTQEIINAVRMPHLGMPLTSKRAKN